MSVCDEMHALVGLHKCSELLQDGMSKTLKMLLTLSSSCERFGAGLGCSVFVLIMCSDAKEHIRDNL